MRLGRLFPTHEGFSETIPGVDQDPTAIARRRIGCEHDPGDLVGCHELDRHPHAGEVVLVVLRPVENRTGLKERGPAGLDLCDHTCCVLNVEEGRGLTGRTGFPDVLEDETGTDRVRPRPQLPAGIVDLLDDLGRHFRLLVHVHEELRADLQLGVVVDVEPREEAPTLQPKVVVAKESQVVLLRHNEGVGNGDLGAPEFPQVSTLASDLRNVSPTESIDPENPFVGRELACHHASRHDCSTSCLDVRGCWCRLAPAISLHPWKSAQSATEWQVSGESQTRLAPDLRLRFGPAQLHASRGLLLCR